jgi:bifunctional enzyme CysN/CysC
VIDAREGVQEDGRGEVANILLDAGTLLIVTAQELIHEDLEVVKAAVDPDRIELIWVGDRATTDVPYDLMLGEQEAEAEGVDRIKRLLKDKGILFRPW